HRLQQEYDLEAALGQRREVSLLEAAGKLPGQLPGGGQCAGGVIDTQVAASRLRRDHPAGTGHPAAQLEHRNAGPAPGRAPLPPWPVSFPPSPTVRPSWSTGSSPRRPPRTCCPTPGGYE